MTARAEGMVRAVRERAADPVWTAAVKLARDGAVLGVSDDGEEVHLRVKTRGHARPFEVHLWPDEADWGCDCGQPADPCVHVCAATIALQHGGGPDALPKPQKHFQVKLRYLFTSAGRDQLQVSRRLLWPDGREEPLPGSLAETDVMVANADAQAETLLAMQAPGPLSGEALRRLLVLLDLGTELTLDGRPVRLEHDPVVFPVKVRDHGESGLRVALSRPEADRLFRGAALVDGALRPTSYGELTPEQRRVLLRGIEYTKDEVRGLLTDALPRLRARIPVQVESQRLPTPDALVPRVLVDLQEREAGLEVRTSLVYGDPPVATIEAGVVKLLGEVLVARDLHEERLAVQRFERTVGLPVPYRRVLPPDKAAMFLRAQLPSHRGPVRGRVREDRYQVVEAPVRPEIAVEAQAAGSWGLQVRFKGEQGEADPRAVLAAWTSGRTLVPLLQGGYAPLPDDWLTRHGGLLLELLEARDAQGRVDRTATAALVELLEDTQADVPPDLRRLQDFLEGRDELPEANLPASLEGRLRPYQEAGVRWLRFLRGVHLSGILADDMGLGKTVQALAAMSEAGGRHLVVAPTSVLRNWQREAARFVPDLTVNLYHGPDRRLDDSDLTLTSYALLRMDVEQLRERTWTYVVLDEAQAIKNADSLTARSARRLPAEHRLALTGTPVENRLEELWSLFRFLMPGFLGSIEAFKERFVRPIEAGDGRVRDALRKRVRPYVLRRLKGQVARELPPLTDMVIRCEMGEAQRRVYEAVRLAARADVQRAISERGSGGATLQVLEALLRMRQACCDPGLLPGEVGAEAGACKLDRLEELIVEIVCEEHKALVFSQWTSLLDRVEPRLRALGIPWVRLDGTTRDRQTVIDRFQSEDGPPVFLLSLKAGGTGLNLTAADYVVHLDPWWNPAVQQQATDRAHRIGQDRPVVSCRLVVEDTVEERILELQDAKRSLAEAAIGAEGGFLRALSADDLRRLFDAA